MRRAGCYLHMQGVASQKRPSTPATSEWAANKPIPLSWRSNRLCGSMLFTLTYFAAPVTSYKDGSVSQGYALRSVRLSENCERCTGPVADCLVQHHQSNIFITERVTWSYTRIPILLLMTSYQKHCNKGELSKADQNFTKVATVKLFPYSCPSAAAFYTNCIAFTEQAMKWH